MKRWTTALLALVVALGLTACGSPPPTSPPPGSAGESAPQTQPTPEGDSPSGDDSEQPDGFVKYTPAETKLYANSDVIVFEFTDASVATFAAMAAEGQEISIVFELPRFETRLAAYNGDVALTGAYENRVNNTGVFSSPPSPDYRMDWVINDKTIQVACKAHGYDVDALLGDPNARVNVTIYSPSEQLALEGAMLSKVGISTMVPAQFADPITFSNRYSAADLPLLRYASLKTDDYYATGEADHIEITYYNEDGYDIYQESIYPDKGIVPPGWENEKGNMRHPSNDKILIHGQENDPHYLSTKGRSMYHFWSDQLLQKEDNTRDIWYFSDPTLTVRQMYAQEQPNQ